jgi:ABC-2 type transport system permease protein
MSFGILLRNESIKASRFLPFRVTTIAFTALMGIIFAQGHLNSIKPGRQPWALPAAWNEILSDPVQISLFFLSVLVVLLVANEFTWRTARQNVIDGLSKEEWFAGKVIVLPLLVALFFTVIVGLGAFFASLGNDPAPGGPLLPAADAKIMGATLLAQLGYASLALLVATAIRGAGSAIGVFFLYAAFIERLLGALLNQAGETIGRMAKFLPAATFNAIIERIQWDPAAFERAVQNATRNNRPAPVLVDSTLLVAVATAWIVTFLAVAFISFRKRDL